MKQSFYYISTLTGKYYIVDGISPSEVCCIKGNIINNKFVMEDRVIFTPGGFKWAVDNKQLIKRGVWSQYTRNITGDCEVIR